MADNFNTELEELTKQFFFIMKDALPKMEELSKVVPELKDLPSQVSALSTKIDNLQQEMTEKVDSINSVVSSHSSLLKEYEDALLSLDKTFSLVRNQIDIVEQNCNNLTTDVENLSKNMDDCSKNCKNIGDTVTNLTNVVIPELEEKIDNAGGSGGGAEINWIPIYDKDSDDPKVNWGLQTGILGGLGDLSSVAPDFTPYKKLKVIFYAMETRHVITFETDMDNDKFQYYVCLVMKQALDAITGASFCLIKENGIKRFFMQDIRNYKFNYNQSPTITIVDNNEKYCFERIYGSI